MEAQAAAQTAPAAPPPVGDGTEAAKTMPKTLFVVDTTARPGTGHKDSDAASGLGPRNHQQIVDGRVKNFTFEPGKPLELPFAVAIKFLRIAEFIRTDERGEEMPYQRQPRQPHEMGAGEKFELKDHQTVADYNELSNMALLQRTLELPGGELIAQRREAMIAFIVKTTMQRRKENEEKQPNARRAAADAEPELADIEPIDDSDFN